MSDLVVIGFDDEHEAFELRATLAKLQKVFWLAAIVILFSGYVYADDPRDANYWNRMDMGQKQSYVAGVSDGINIASMVLSQDQNVDKKCQTLVDACYRATKEKYFINITNSQLSDGLDVFYSNYNNQNISTDKAVWILLKTIHNDPENEINELIKSWRKVTSP
jgi:hypothetical protein